MKTMRTYSCKHSAILLIMLCALWMMPQKAQSQKIEQDAIELMSDTANAKRVRAAIAMANKVKKLGNYIKNLQEVLSNGELPLPCGLGEGRYTLVLSDIQHGEDGITKITATTAIGIGNDTIAFGGTCSLSGQCGTAMPTKIELLAQRSVSIGKNIRLTFNKGSYCEFDCDGITQFFADITVAITSDKIIAYDSNFKPTDKSPSFNIQTFFESFEDLTFEINANLNFGIKGLNDFVFTMNNLVLDKSETRTPASVRFPDNYFSSNAEIKLWEGFSAKTIAVALPESFCKNGNSRTQVGCQSLIIDKYGITLTAFVENIQHQKIDTTKWQIMADAANLSLTKNKIDSISFYGIANIPPFGKNSKMDFVARYNDISKQFDFTCNLKDTLDFPVFGANLTLQPSSYINLSVGKEGFYPLIHADGTLSINTELEKLKVTLPDIKFEGMEISNRKPYFKPGVMSLAVSKLSMPSIGGFQLEIDDIGFENEALAFTIKLKLNEMLNGAASLKLEGDFNKYKIKNVSLSRAEVHYKAENTLSIDGAVEIKKGDEIYGNGFRGDLDVKLLNKYGLNAVGVFGKKDGNRYFLADVLLEADPIFTIPPCISVSGLGGGLYRHMDQTLKDYSFGKAISGICYVPNEKVGFGFLAHANFYVAQKNTLNAKTSFEVQFNDNWGLNYVQFKGDVAFMRDPKKWGGLSEGMMARVKQQEQAGGVGNLKQEYRPSEEKPKDNGGSDGMLSASVLMKYDNTNKIFNMDLKTYLNIAGIIKGTGANDMLVWAKARFGDSDWYLHMGTPDNRCGVKVLDFVKLDSYFMLGNGLPELPPPPDKVLSDLSAAQKDDFLRRIHNDMPSSGKGIAFGLGFNTHLKPSVGPFYAKLDIGAGGEFMLADYGKNAYCKGREGTLGINGWYAEAQIWAYLDAAVGLQAKLFGKRRNFDILALHAGTCLKGMGPNPFYFTGIITGSYRVLGGLIKGKCHIDFECGTKCEPVKGGPLLGEDMIAQITPGNGDKDVSVFAAPQLLLNVASETEMTIEDNRGEKGTYRIILDHFTVKKEDGTKVEGKSVRSDDGLSYTFDPEEAFESTTPYTVSARVLFQKKFAGRWVTYTEDGGDYAEEKTVRFTSGKRPDHILPEHILCAYPQLRQYNFYPKEWNDGYILVKENYSYLFTTVPEGYMQRVRVETLDGKGKDITFSSKTISQYGAKYEIDFNLGGLQFGKNEIYRLSVLNIPKEQAKIDANVSRSETSVSDEITQRKIEAEGELDILETKELTSYCFRTSKFNTFKEKVASLKLSGTSMVIGTENAQLNDITRNIINDEFPDGYEYQHSIHGKGLSNDHMMVLEPLLDQTQWFNNSIFQYIYKEYKASDLNNDKTSNYSFPPNDAMTIRNSELLYHGTLNDNEIAQNRAIGLDREGSIGYYVVFQCDRDARKVRDIVAQKVLQKQPLPGHDKDFRNYVQPKPYTPGDYPFKVSYRLPGKNIITSSVTEKFVVQ